MDTVYDVLIALAKEHKKIKIPGHSGGYTDMFRFNLRDKSIENGQIYLMLDGKLCMDRIETTDGVWYQLEGLPLIRDNGNFYKEVEKLYRIFNNSVPTKHDCMCRDNFKAKHVDELSFRQMMKNEKRPVARYMLEAYIMFRALNHTIKWRNDKHFFWQSNEQPQLVLFKDWCLLNVRKGERQCLY